MGRRREGREAAVQYLFAHELHEGHSAPCPEEQRGFWELHSAKAGARAYAEDLVRGVHEHMPDIDRHIRAACDNFSIDRVGNVERNILRLAIYEFLHAKEVPAPVVINEAIEITKKFCSGESSGFINGVLDRIAKELRPK